MLTPQELNDRVFTKAVFGGYDIRSTDEFLDTVTEDYAALYKENAVLKSKLRILVEKLEEYRQQEAPMQSAILSAQKKATRIVKEAEEEAAQIVRQARQAAASSKAPSQETAAPVSDAQLGEVQATVESVISQMEQELEQQHEVLEKLKQIDLTPAPVPAEPEEAAAEAPEESEQPEDSAEEITEEIEQQLEKLVGSDPEADDMSDTKVVRGLHPESITAKFGELKFGKNYNPNK